MAVNINTNTAADLNTTAADNGLGAGVFKQPQPQQQNNVGSAASNLFNMFASPVQPGMVTNTLLEKFTKEIQALQLAPGFNKKVFCIDNAIETDFAFSVITICIEKDGHSIAVPILVEGSGGSITPVFDNMMNRQVEILRTTVDAFDPIMDRKIRDTVKSQSSSYTVLEGIIFPREANPEDRMTVLKVILHATGLIGAEFSLQNGIDISAEPIKSKMAVDIQFGKVQNTDYLLPKRSDINVSLNIDRANQPNQNKYFVNSDSSRNETISKTGAFVDFIYAPGLAIGMPNPLAQQKSFIANYVITSVKPKVLTPASMMLAIISALSVKNDNVWLNSLKPGFNNSDVGYLNVQGNITADPKGIGEAIDTSAAAFGVADLMRLVQTLVHDNIIVSIDIDKNDEAYAGMSFLEGAAYGKQSSVDVIIAACDKLTGGHFGKFYNPANPIFVNRSRLHRGYYVDQAGSLQDLRNFDYLKIVEILGAKNIDVIVEYNNTFNVNIPEVIRLEKRKKILEMVTNGNIHIKGWTERLTFSAAFIDALNAALRAQGAMFKIYQNFNNEFVGSNFANYFGAAALTGSVPAMAQGPMGLNPYFGNTRWQ